MRARLNAAESGHASVVLPCQVGVAKMADVLTNLGLPDPDAMGHTLFLNQYAKERGTSGPVKFDEAVAVCNAALHRGPTVGRKKSAIPALPAISKCAGHKARPRVGLRGALDVYGRHFSAL